MVFYVDILIILQHSDWSVCIIPLNFSGVKEILWNCRKIRLAARGQFFFRKGLIFFRFSGSIESPKLNILRGLFPGFATSGHMGSLDFRMVESPVEVGEGSIGE